MDGSAEKVGDLSSSIEEEKLFAAVFSRSASVCLALFIDRQAAKPSNASEARKFTSIEFL
jgi:hypothetical protein